MVYNRKPMPIPWLESYDRPPPYREENLVPPPIPPRRRAVPPLPPRPPSADSEGEDVTITTRAMSQLNVGSNSSVDFDGVFERGPPLDVFVAGKHELNLPSNIDNKGSPVETNKFYGNMLIGSQATPVWTHPYSLWWAKDGPYFGIAVAHTRASQRVFGNGTPPQFFFNPVGIKSFVFSSVEFASADDFSLQLRSPKHMSCQLYLAKNQSQYIHLPLVQGMGFVTAIYSDLIPKIYSGVGFRDFRRTDCSSGYLKYEVLLENGVTWMLYIKLQSEDCFEVVQQDGNTLVGSCTVRNCVIQIVASSSSDIDLASGCYPIDCKLTCATRGNVGTYSLNYITDGSSSSGETLMFALPHHVNNFSNALRSQPSVCRLDSTVKGLMYGYLTRSLEMEIEIPESLEFQPMTTITGKNCHYSNDVLDCIKKAALSEIHGDVLSESNLDSMYFSGKILAKYAWILYCCQYIIEDKNMVSVLLPNLKAAMKRFTENTQILPLRYDKTWGGLISSGSSSQDFGNSYYNDHHFHYSYHVITAAILAKVDGDAGDKTWLPKNRRWVEHLIRDYANPSEKDAFFPVFRSFDWFNGHSFAKGLFESGDGKDQESSSEDVNASYALKLWGLVTNNQFLVRIADIQLGILRTSVNLYFLYSNDNNVMPPSFIPNKVSGILFENKIDHTTYFGNELQYIQMIHAIPITSASSFIRTPKFVEEEWHQKLVPIVNDVKDGWKGIMMLNVALFNPRQSFDFFSKADHSCLDNGQSLTWSLAYSGAFL